MAHATGPAPGCVARASCACGRRERSHSAAPPPHTHTQKHMHPPMHTTNQPLDPPTNRRQRFCAKPSCNFTAGRGPEALWTPDSWTVDPRDWSAQRWLSAAPPGLLSNGSTQRGWRGGCAGLGERVRRLRLAPSVQAKAYAMPLWYLRSRPRMRRPLPPPCQALRTYGRRSRGPSPAHAAGRSCSAAATALRGTRTHRCMACEWRAVRGGRACWQQMRAAFARGASVASRQYRPPVCAVTAQYPHFAFPDPHPRDSRAR